jgi:hypothetical protein
VHTPSLEAAIEDGIKARESQAKGDKRRRGNAPKRQEEEKDRVWLEASGKRLRSLLAWIEANEE